MRVHMVVHTHAHTCSLRSTSPCCTEVPKKCISYCPAPGSQELELSLSIYMKVLLNEIFSIVWELNYSWLCSLQHEEDQMSRDFRNHGSNHYHYLHHTTALRNSWYPILRLCWLPGNI